MKLANKDQFKNDTLFISKYFYAASQEIVYRGTKGTTGPHTHFIQILNPNNKTTKNPTKQKPKNNKQKSSNQ